MRRTAAGISLLLSVWTASAVEGVLQEPIYRAYKAHGGADTNARSISGLLERQNCGSGYGYCSETGICCQLGGRCCSSGGCCPPGAYCTAPRHCCYNNQGVCESVGCCYSYEHCCRDAGCCPSGSYCVVGSNGRIGCCPIGTTCSGPITGGGGGSSGGSSGGNSGGNSGGSSGGNSGGSSGGSSGGNSGSNSGGNSGGTTGGDSGNTTPPPSSSTTSTSTTPPSSPITTTTSPSSSGTPAPVPAPLPGFTSVVIAADDPLINWSAGGWTLNSQSSCDQTKPSRKTTDVKQWLTFITPTTSSSSIYLDISWNGASFEIFFDGVQQDIRQNTLTNCKYHQIGPIKQGVTVNVTIFVFGPLMSGRQLASTADWSFEFNSFVIGTQTSSSSGGSGSSSNSASRYYGPEAVVAIVAVLSTVVTLLV